MAAWPNSSIEIRVPSEASFSPTALAKLRGDEPGDAHALECRNDRECRSPQEASHVEHRRRRTTYRARQGQEAWHRPGQASWGMAVPEADTPFAGPTRVRGNGLSTVWNASDQQTADRKRCRTTSRACAVPRDALPRRLLRQPLRPEPLDQLGAQPAGAHERVLGDQLLRLRLA